METLENIPIYSFPKASSFEEWLEKNHGLQTGIWLKIAKKASGIPSVTRKDALDVALCYGWIDGQGRSLDEAYYLQKFTPRRVRSLWSKVNIKNVERLIADGRMRASGLAAIEAAQADGRWDAAYESQANATLPDDLSEYLANNEKARTFFGSLTRSAQYGFEWRLMTARTATTRARRLEKMIIMLENKQIF